VSDELKIAAQNILAGLGLTPRTLLADLSMLGPGQDAFRPDAVSYNLRYENGLPLLLEPEYLALPIDPWMYSRPLPLATDATGAALLRQWAARPWQADLMAPLIDRATEIGDEVATSFLRGPICVPQRDGLKRRGVQRMLRHWRYTLESVFGPFAETYHSADTSAAEVPLGGKG
jgi:hypothetical protein